MGTGRTDAMKHFRRTTLLTLLPLLLPLAACEPDIQLEDPPAFMQFDTESEPTRTPEPNAVVINPDTGLIDFGVLGQWLPTYPEDCQNQPSIPVATCEFNVYLETLDGFPTVSTFTAPVSTALDMSSVVLGETVVVLDDRGNQVMDVDVSFDASTNKLVFDRADGWDIGRTYVVAVRGYDNGVRAADGRRVVASSVYYLLKQEESLVTCAPDPQELPADEQILNPQCKWYELMVQNYGEAAAPETLRTLETLRLAFLQQRLWDAVQVVGQMPKDEVAIVWAVPIHSASVAELNPDTGKVPIAASDDTILLRVKGTVDPATLKAFDMLDGSHATVILLNLTALAAEDMLNGFPAFTVQWNTTENAIQINAAQPLVDGTLYGLILTGPARDEDAPRAGVKDAQGRPLVPSPVPVLLRSRGPVVDSQGHSVVSVLDDAQAAELEAGRLQLKDLLDNEMFMGLANLTRENIIYLYGFEWGQ